MLRIYKEYIEKYAVWSLTFQFSWGGKSGPASMVE